MTAGYDPAQKIALHSPSIQEVSKRFILYKKYSHPIFYEILLDVICDINCLGPSVSSLEVLSLINKLEEEFEQRKTSQHITNF